MKRKITRFARALKCGDFGASGFVGAAPALPTSKPALSSIDASASIPKPPPARRRNSRRFDGTKLIAPGPGHLSRSIHINECVQVEDRAAKFLRRAARKKFSR